MAIQPKNSAKQPRKPGKGGGSSAPVSEASLLLDDQLCFALYSATHSIQRLYRPLLQELDLTYPQYLVLLILWEQDQISVSAIGDRMRLTSASLTPILKRMETAGFIERQRSGEDERRVTISLTAAGVALKGKVHKITTGVTCAAADATKAPADLLRTLVQLRDSLPEAI